MADKAITVEYGKRIEAEEIEQQGPASSSLLVTRGHVEVELFIQRAGSSVAVPSGPVATYSGAPQIRAIEAQGSGSTNSQDGPVSPSGRSRGSGAPTLGLPANGEVEEGPSITLNAQLDLDMTTGVVVLRAATAKLLPEDLARLQDARSVIRIRMPFIRAYAHGVTAPPAAPAPAPVPVIAQVEIVEEPAPKEAAPPPPPPPPPAPPAPELPPMSTQEFLDSLHLQLDMKEAGDEEGVDSLRAQFACTGLEKKDLIGSSDPYIVISQVKPDGGRVRVYQSSVIKNNLNPVWPPVNLYLPILCNGDAEQQMVVEVWDFNKKEEHELIGETARLTLADIVDAPDAKTTFPLINPAKAGKKGYTNSGLFGVSLADPYNAPRIQEYLAGGLRFKSMMAVDFTAENGAATSPDSLHYLGSNGSLISNPYTVTMAVLATVMQKLNGGRPIEAFGFGGTPAGSKTVPAIFPLSSSGALLEDASALVDAYRASVASVKPGDKRNYNAVLQQAVAAIAKEGQLSQRNQHYTMLSLLTCGPMDDVEATVQALLASTTQPLSVLIIGIGRDEITINTKFATVRSLDEQLAGLHTKKVMSLRDNLTFVTMSSSMPRVEGASALASSSMTVGCDQVVSFLQYNEIDPGAGPEGPTSIRGKAVPPPVVPPPAPVAEPEPTPLTTEEFLASLALDLTVKKAADAVDSLRAQFACTGLEKKDMFGSSDPYVVISQVKADGSRVRVYQSSFIANNLNPLWPAVNLYLPIICNSNPDQALIVEVWDHNKNEEHELIGETAQLVLADIVDAPEAGTTFPLTNPAKAGKKGYTNSGLFGVKLAETYNSPQVSDYVAGGLRCKATMVVDFTSANGPASNRGSLHYLGNDKSIIINPYTESLAVMTAVMQKLNGGAAVEAYGFGATPANTKGAASAVFPLSAEALTTPAAVVNAYRATVPTLKAGSARNYTSVLEAAVASVTKEGKLTQRNQHYTLLNLFTCAPMDDVEASVHALLASTTQALSIIIIGVGHDSVTVNTKFAAVRALDEQLAGLHTKKVMSLRDNLTFFPVAGNVQPRVDVFAALASGAITVSANQLVSFMQWSDVDPGAGPEGPTSIRGKAITEPATAEAFLESLHLQLDMLEAGDEGGVDSLHTQFVATNLEKKDVLGSSDPYVVVSQVKPDGSRVRVHQSSVIKNNLNPVWPPVNLYLPILCNSDVEQPLVVEVWDFNKKEEHELIGETVQLTVEDFIFAQEKGKTYPLTNPAKVGTKGYTNSGFLGLKEADPYNAPSLHEYLAGGLRFKCMMAVDFTAENGVPTSDQSMHYLGNGKSGMMTNPYTVTLAVLSSVMQKLNSGRPIEAFGFGGTPAGAKTMPAIFPLSSKTASLDDAGKLVIAYREAIETVKAGAVRNYNAVLQQAVAAIAKEGQLSQRNQHYTMLSLLTCGPMHDVEASVQSLLAATQLPLSVLIIGIGKDGETIDTKFVTVRTLDDHLAGLHSKKVMSLRDNLTFVPMAADIPRVEGASELASTAMTAGIHQVVSFLQYNNIDPGAGPEGPTSIRGKPVMATATTSSFIDSLHLQLESKTAGDDDGQDSMRAVFTATGLDKKDVMGSSDPYIVISQVKPDGSRVRVYQSSVIKNILNPVWPATNIYLPIFCNSSAEQPLIVEVWDYNKNEEHELIGETAQITLADIVDAPESKTGFPLINPALVGKKKGYTNSGTFGVSAAELYNAPSVHDYLDGGMRFKSMMAIDFTAANGSIDSGDSLHFLAGGNGIISNPYTVTLAVMATVMQKLNGGRAIQAFGFGGVPAGGKASSTVFPLSPAGSTFETPTALVDAYRSTVTGVKPTEKRNYAAVLEAAAAAIGKEGKVSQRNQHYTVLNLLTCGPMDDAEATIKQLLAATQLPISVLIIGVGKDLASVNTKFVSVRKLDEQLAGLNSKRVMALRDNLTFVPIGIDQPRVEAASSLASTAMTATCDQVVSFLQYNEIDPGAGPEGPTSIRGKPIPAPSPPAPPAPALPAALPPPPAASLPPPPPPPPGPPQPEPASTAAFLESLHLQLDIKDGGDEDGVDALKVQFACTGLDKKDLIGSSDPYIVISQVKPDGSRVRVYQSNVIMNNLNPTFPATNLYLPVLCNSDTEQPLVVEVFDYNKNEEHEIIGETAQITLADIVDAPESKTGFPLINPAKVGKRGYNNSGVLHVKSAAAYNAPAVQQYLSSGLRFKCMMAVDFTAENGAATSPDSLHYLGANGSLISNPYTVTLAVLATVMQKLNGGRPIEAFGFGGAPAGSKGTPAVFPLAGASATVADPTALVDAYRTAVTTVKPGDKRNYNAVLQQAVAEIKKDGALSQANQHYTMLCLLTCGPMDDAEATVQQLLAATQLPLSVLIVGVGKSSGIIDTKFVTIKALDEQLAGLHTKKVMSLRDNLTFVPMAADVPRVKGASELASTALTATLDQMTAFLQTSDISPAAAAQQQ